MAIENRHEGASLSAKRLVEVLDHVFNTNSAIEKADKTGGTKGVPVCIWGPHGIGKTEIVKDYAQQHGWQFAYCPVAQFQEFGDLHGLPAIVDPDETIIGDEYTVFRPPDWVPRVKGPGILLLDDINRADDRILRGLMQLLQYFSLVSWALPPQWQIVATANPEGGDYSVTPMDDAMLTRMIHFSLAFEPKVWASWATRKGIDRRGITFVLAYPECVTGKRTTARSLVQFFDMIKPIENLKTNSDIVLSLARGCLDESTAVAFLTFATSELEKLPDPSELLFVADFAKIKKKLQDLVTAPKGGRRIDKLSVFMTRLLLEMQNPKFSAAKANKENLVKFLLMEEIPNDLRYAFWLDVSAIESESVRALLRDKRLAVMTLKGL